MLFNSIDFALFLPVVFGIYWLLAKGSLKKQNLFITAASYFFYGCWDWRFLFLIFISTAVDFLVGVKLEKTSDSVCRKRYLLFSLTTNLGILGFFKYFNFFADNFNAVFSFLGASFSVDSLQIILPVGISFYTFQTLSYTIDVYRKKITPTHSFIEFAAFVSFFPQLVAGPIERAKNLLPQFSQKRVFSYDGSVNGLRQILWGLFKKVVVADRCAAFVNRVFENPSDYSGSVLLLGAAFFAFQIYCDFSGYSDIAIGTARLFGFNLKRNFAFPYFSRDIAEFWRRWHISLSSWFRDYVYIPLGGSKGNNLQKLRNVLLVFTLSGFWHGANWTFIVWGIYNALLFLPLILAGKNRENIDIAAKGRLFPGLIELGKIAITFLLTSLGWVFFRSDSLSQAMVVFSKVFSNSLFEIPRIGAAEASTLKFILFLIIVEWIGREGDYALSGLGRVPVVLRWAFYYLIIFFLFAYNGEEQVFIYFQF